MTRAIAAVLLLFASDVAHAQDASPNKPSRDWKRLVVDDLEAIGNAPEKDLRRALDEVQRFRGTLLALLPGLNARSAERTTLIVLRDANAFRRFAPRDGRGRRQEGVGGYFFTAPDANFMVVPMLRDREAMFRTVFHEYTHYLVYRNMRHVPRWLNEGIADLYSTFSIDGNGKTVIGKAPPGRIGILQTRPLIPLDRFLDPETSARLFESERDTAMFYAQAWAFVHFMTLGDKGSRQGQIMKYLNALQTSPPAEAARGAFGA